MQFNTAKMKTSLEEQYFKFNRIILLATGLWPYQQAKSVQLQVTSFLGILMSFIAFQFSRIFFVDSTFDFTIKSLCVASVFTFFAMNYISFWINIDTMGCIMERLQYIYDNLQDENETTIYEKYGNIAKRITITFIIAEICCLLFPATLQVWTKLLLTIMPNNKTYTYSLKLLISKHFAVQEKYSSVILLHIGAAITIGTLASVAAATTILSYIIHIWGVFRIASYRLEQAMNRTVSQNIMSKKRTTIYEGIICAVDIHRKAMEFAIFLMESMNRSYFCIIISTVLCVSFNLYQVCRFGSSTEDIEETIANFIIVIFVFVYMFLLNFAGQEITDYNNDIFFTAYNSPWYLAPLHIQKLILFLLQRGSKAFTINIGGLFIMSVECFASLSSAALSYLTVMLSVKK